MSIKLEHIDCKRDSTITILPNHPIPGQLASKYMIAHRQVVIFGAEREIGR